MAVNLVSSVQILVKHEEIRQRYRKIIDALRLEYMLLPVINQLVEATPRLKLSAQLS